MKDSQSGPMLSFSIALSATLFTTISPAATIGYYTFTTATAGLGSKVVFNQSYYDPASGKTPTIANGGALTTIQSCNGHDYASVGGSSGGIFVPKFRRDRMRRQPRPALALRLVEM